MTDPRPTCEEAIKAMRDAWPFISTEEACRNMAAATDPLTRAIAILDAKLIAIWASRGKDAQRGLFRALD